MTGLIAKRATKATMDAINGSDAISAADFQRVCEWIASGCPETPDTCFTSGIARDVARLVAEARQAAIADGVKAAAALLGVTADDIRLAAGEMTAQDMRTARAVLVRRKAAILRKAREINA